MIKQILVAIDHSPISQQVFDQALNIAQANQANLILLHVLSVAESDYTQHVYFTQSRFGSKYSNLRGINLLRTYAQKAIAMGIKTEYSQITGCPGSTICEFAHSCYADLIVLGDRGYSKLTKSFLGSVSKYVLQHAPCPISLVEAPIIRQINRQPEEIQIYA